MYLIKVIRIAYVAIAATGIIAAMASFTTDPRSAMLILLGAAFVFAPWLFATLQSNMRPKEYAPIVGTAMVIVAPFAAAAGKYLGATPMTSYAGMVFFFFFKQKTAYEIGQ